MRVRAVVLDVRHQLLLPESGELPATEVPSGTRPLSVVSARGLTCGRRVDGDETWFVFVEPSIELTPGHRLVPLPEWSTMPALAGAWALYVDALLGGWEPPTRALDVFFFGDGPALAAVLAHLVVKGEKRATAGWVAAAEREGATIPRVGLISIVTDGFGYPLCAIQTERVDFVRFADATDEIAEAEAEGDRTLDDWRFGHRGYFEREAARLGLTFDGDAVLFLEYFRVLRVLQRSFASTSDL